MTCLEESQAQSRTLKHPYADAADFGFDASFATKQDIKRLDAEVELIRSEMEKLCLKETSRELRLSADVASQIAMLRHEMKMQNEDLQQAVRDAHFKFSEVSGSEDFRSDYSSGAAGSKAQPEMESVRNSPPPHRPSLTIETIGSERAISYQAQVQYTYNLQESIWDAGILIGVPTLGFQSSVYLAATLLVNCVVQAVFSGIVWVAFNRGDFDEDVIFALKVWRRNSAHDASNVNEMWPYSIANRICHSDLSLHMSAQQAYLFDSIEKFRPQQARFLGWLMCVLSLLCLWTILWSDIRDTFKYARSVIMLHKQNQIGARTRFVPVDDGLFEFRSISRRRISYVWTIILSKILVNVNLAVVGTRWLVRETNVEDLLLNALALEMILNVDELLYNGLAPIRAKVLVTNCKPFKIWGVINKKTGIEGIALMGMIWIFVALPVVCFTIVGSTDASVSRAYDEICGGVTNFVHAVDPLGIVYVRDKMSDVNRRYVDDMDLRVLALDEVIEGTPSEDWEYAVHMSDLQSLKSMSTMPYAQLSYEINPSCGDLLGPLSDKTRPHLNTLRHAAGDMSIDGCSAVEPYCYGLSKAAALSWMLCPVTCGCLSPVSGTMLVGWATIHGCPHACEALLSDAASHMDTCPEEAELSSSEVWQTWMQELRLLWPQEFHMMIAPLEDLGCHGLERIPIRQNLCGGSGAADSLKPLAPACPAACGCNLVNGTVGAGIQNLDWCPMACLQLGASVQDF